MFLLGKMAMVLLCVIFCSNAQNKGPHNKVISSMADIDDTPVVSASHFRPDGTKNVELPFHCGDAIGITVSPDTVSFLTGQYPIDDEGYIYLPLVGKKQISSMTQEDLEDFINTSYVKYLRIPGVQVKPLLRIELMGGFQKPGFYYVSPHTSFWEVVRLAGAPIREDGIEKLKLKRSGATIDFDPVLGIESAQSLRQMGIRSGDQIMVTARPLQTAWDRFKDDVLPILSLTLSLAATTATAYISYETFQGRR